MKIYLDDIRKPYDSSWILVRSYDEFVKLVRDTRHIITHLSLDHDLGEENGVIAKTGMDAAKFFIEYVIDNPDVGNTLEVVHAHSSNPPGRDNIKGIFNSARKNGIFNTDLMIT